MTIWKAGMLAVCIDRKGVWVSSGREEYADGPESGEVLLVLDAKPDSNGLIHLSFAKFGARVWFQAQEFRPAVQDGLSEKASKRISLDDLMPVKVSK